MAKRHNSTKTIRIQLSLDPNSAALLEQIASYGAKGKNKSEVATRLLQDFLIDNGRDLIEKLESNLQTVNKNIL